MITIVPLRVRDSKSDDVLEGRFEVRRITGFQHNSSTVSGSGELIVESGQQASQR